MNNSRNLKDKALMVTNATNLSKTKPYLNGKYN